MFGAVPSEWVGILDPLVALSFNLAAFACAKESAPDPSEMLAMMMLGGGGSPVSREPQIGNTITIDGTM